MQAADILGKGFKNGTAILLARILGNDGVAVQIADVSAIKYSAYAVNESDPNERTPVDGHDDVSLVPGEVLFDTLQKDPRWTVDNTGYNLLHQPDRDQDEIFPIAGKNVLVEYRLTPTDGGQVIVIRFKINVI